MLQELEKYYKNTFPIETSAGNAHYSNAEYANKENYFAHTRIEDIPGDTRRVIELQSDLFQKGRLEGEAGRAPSGQVGGKNLAYVFGEKPDVPITERLDELQRRGFSQREINKLLDMSPESLSETISSRQKELSKLKPYENAWHERIIREEVRSAARDGKKAVLFPTGETAMKVEGLGQADIWYRASGEQATGMTANDLKIGKSVFERNDAEWVITDVLGDGKFKAVQKESSFGKVIQEEGGNVEKVLNRVRKELGRIPNWGESFDISGKADKENPIFKFYEKEVGKFLKKIKPDMRRIKDAQGVEWWQIEIKPEDKNKVIAARFQQKNRVRSRFT